MKSAILYFRESVQEVFSSSLHLGYLRIAELCIFFGAQVNPEGAEYPPLRIAMRNLRRGDNLAIIDMLANKGADLFNIGLNENLESWEKIISSRKCAENDKLQLTVEYIRALQKENLYQRQTPSKPKRYSHWKFSLLPKVIHH